MRIALVVPGGVDRSGEYRVIPALLALIERLAAQHEVHVFALRQEAQPADWTLAGAHIRNIGFTRTPVRAVRAICALHRSARVDVVHAIWSGACGMVAVAAAKILGLPSLIHIAGGELVALHEIGFGGRLTWRARLGEAVVLRGTSAITAASDPIIRMLSQLGLTATRVPLGVDLNVWPPRAPTPRDPARPAQLLHVASLNLVKDQSTLLRALDRLGESGLRFEMNIIGEDVLQGAVQWFAAQCGLSEHVHFRGFLPQRLLRPWVESADVNIITSRHEAGPLVVLEAAVAGVPTVGTAVGHVAEWAPSAALSVPVGDWAALASAIGQLIQDDGHRLRLAHEAQRRAILEDADYTASRFEALYSQLSRSR